MQDNDMREKLEKIISAYEELQAKMSDPAVLADQKAYNHLAKEYANQGPLTAKAREYLACCSDIDDAKEMLADPDMKEFAQETIAEAESKMPALEEDIKFMLIPSDPADGRTSSWRSRCCRRREAAIRGRPVQDVLGAALPRSGKIEAYGRFPVRGRRVQISSR